MATLRSLARFAILGLAACHPNYELALREHLDAHDLASSRAVLDQAVQDTRVPPDRHGLALLERASVHLASNDVNATLRDVIAADSLIALGNDSSTRVEARRFANIRTQMHEYAISEGAYRLMAAGGLLAAWAFESSNRSEACLFAKEAALSQPTPLLAREAARLCDEAQPTEVAPPTTGVAGELRGFISVGMAPRKEVRFQPSETAAGLCFRLDEGPPAAAPILSVDGVERPAELLVDLATYSFEFWEAARGKVGCNVSSVPHYLHTAPARIYGFVVPLSLGPHHVKITSGGEEHERTVQITERGGARVVVALPFSVDVRSGAAPRRLEHVVPPPRKR
jgi:hypothetical protein